MLISILAFLFDLGPVIMIEWQDMGMTYVKAKVKNSADRSRLIEEDFMVDSGAIYTVVPGERLRALGIEPDRKQEFVLADGAKVIRRLGDAVFEVERDKGAAPVVFGEEGDSWLLGAFTLEALGLILDPFRRELRPMKVMTL